MERRWQGDANNMATAWQGRGAGRRGTNKPKLRTTRKVSRARSTRKVSRADPPTRPRDARAPRRDCQGAMEPSCMPSRTAGLRSHAFAQDLQPDRNRTPQWPSNTWSGVRAPSQTCASETVKLHDPESKEGEEAEKRDFSPLARPQQGKSHRARRPPEHLHSVIVFVAFCVRSYVLSFFVFLL